MNAAHFIELSHSESFISNALAQSPRVSVDILELRTTDEGLCSANLFACRKNEVPNEAVAFFTLLNHALHFYEEWPMSETSANDLKSIANKWLTPEIQKAQDTSYSDALAQIEDITSSIQYHIKEKVNSRSMYNPDRWGVFLNGEKLSGPHEAWTPLPNCNVIALANEWNEMEFLYEASNSFILFSWGTGA
ncbi:hypothetical protein [Stutzerimonas decontaminans]|jgi:hypothetical protein|uniref:hypothetical protein n=1 Tax=Stutzerimonas decontaminans TaxID=3022791 RepID=UPI0011AFC1F2|nr:hypothetical protein [Stutzerimonas decontaminans]MCQ4244447.1 hypothetical protein [Stutzerimonas decontaminans]